MKSIKAPMGGRYRQEFIKCNNPRCKKCQEGGAHGPYWYRFWWESGKTRKEYIGKNLPLPKTPDEDLPKTEESLPKTKEEIVERAIEAIKDFHSRGMEPSVSEVAEVVGGHPKHLGRWVKDATGLEAQLIRTGGGRRARRYLKATD